MRRLAPPAAPALPPIPAVEVSSDGSGWTITDRRPPVGGQVSQAPIQRGKITSLSPNAKKVGLVPKSARGVPGEREAPPGGGAAGPGGGNTGTENLEVPAWQHQSQISSEDPSPSARSPTAGGPSLNASRQQQNVMKGRAIQNWLNHALAQAGKPDGAISSTAAKQMAGLAQFGIDNAALEKLGLDADSAERVYRAMFVYSQGLHAVLQEAVGRAKSSSAALLVLWRAFTAVLEHAGQSEEKGGGLAALVQRGNEEEKARLDAAYRNQITTLQNQTQKLTTQRRGLQEELGRLREDEMRLRSESDMYRSEHEVAMNKYEKEIKLRVDAEVQLLDRTRWGEALEEDLNKEREHSEKLQKELTSEIGQKETAQMELESTRNQVRVLETQAQTFKQAVVEAQQARQRHEQQVGQLKQQHDRLERKNAELKEQLEHEQETVKRLTEQALSQQREIRKFERQGEDDSHIRKELQNERDMLKDKLERLEKEFTELSEGRRMLQKQLQDLNMEHRSTLLDLKRKTETLEKTETTLAKVQGDYSSLLDAHRTLVAEADNLREDVAHLDEQCTRESELRKQLQYDKKVQAGQLHTQQIQLDHLHLALQTTQKELQEVTEAKVKLDGVVRDTKSAANKQALEHQVQLRVHMQKVAMLEKVISDERAERRNLVSETQEVTSKREEAVEAIKAKDSEIRELKRQRLEKEEEADRYKILLRAQELRNSEQLVTIDKYHAAVANHDSEMRQMQVLLEGEREEARRKLAEMQEAFSKERLGLQELVEQGNMSYEDALSTLSGNPATQKIQALEVEIEELKGKIAILTAGLAEETSKTDRVQHELDIQTATVATLETKLSYARTETEHYRRQVGEALITLEQQSMAREDAEQQWERLNEDFHEMKSSLEGKLAEARAKALQSEELVPKEFADASTQVLIDYADSNQQTDLSYQYLESSSRLNEERGRRERLTDLKKASRFVEDPQAQRDFVSSQVCQATPIQQVDMEFDRVRGAVPTRTSVSMMHQVQDRPWSGSGGVVGASPPSASVSGGASKGAAARAAARASVGGGVNFGSNAIAATRSEPYPAPLSARPPSQPSLLPPPATSGRSNSSANVARMVAQASRGHSSPAPPSGFPPHGGLNVSSVRSSPLSAR